MEEEDIEPEEPRQEEQKNLPYYEERDYTNFSGMKYKTYSMKENTRPFDLAKALGVDVQIILMAKPNQPYHKPRRMTAYSKLMEKTLLYVPCGPEVIDLTLD